MEFRELMKQFGATIGIEGLAPDETNACSVEIDGMAVAFVEDPEAGTLTTMAEVCEPPAEGEAMLYRVLMQSMFMGEGTAGAVFSVKPDTGRIFLHRTDPLVALDLDAFCAMLEKFVNTLERWRKDIADFRPVAKAVEQAAAAAESPLDRPSDGFLQV